MYFLLLLVSFFFLVGVIISLIDPLPIEEIESIYDFQFLPQSKHVTKMVAGSSALLVCNS
jgi:hypothetical protein